jgi:hypothetical protein
MSCFSGMNSQSWRPDVVLESLCENRVTSGGGFTRPEARLAGSSKLRRTMCPVSSLLCGLQPLRRKPSVSHILSLQLRRNPKE